MSTEVPISKALANLLCAMRDQSGALHLSQAAGSLSFLSLIAIVPMFSIAFAVLAALPVFGRMREGLHRFLDGNLFPAAFSETLLSHVEQFASAAGELSLLGAAAFFVTAFTALLVVEDTLNRIWCVDRRRPLTLRLTLYWTLLTLGPLVLATSLAVNGMLMTSLLRGDTGDLGSLWVLMLPAVLTLAAVTLLFRLMPSTPVRWRDAAAGALLATLLLELMRRVVGLYIAQLPTYTVVYGAFAALPLFLLWLFLGWMALLTGALLAANLRWWRQPVELSVERTHADRFDDARALLAMMADELGPATNAVLAAQRTETLFDRDPLRAAETAALLASLGYLTRYVRIGDPESPSDLPKPRRFALIRRLLASRGAGGVEADDTLFEAPIWSERWGWAGAPQHMSLRPLFEAIWQPTDSDSRRSFPAAFLDLPLVPEIPPEQALPGQTPPGQTPPGQTPHGQAPPERAEPVRLPVSPASPGTSSAR